MWESAERFGAILVFAEHRYYGQSTVGRPKATNDVASSHTMMAASSAPSDLSVAAGVRSKAPGIGADDTGIGIDSDDTGGDGTGIGYDASAARGTSQRLAYLTSEQAMADYATLIREIKDEINSPEAPVIVFGGSYGGMLATWMRLKYPGSVDGAVAGSAPIWSFVGVGGVNHCRSHCRLAKFGSVVV
jgi:lysosomal Pro-X carboxypeptidase